MCGSPSQFLRNTSKEFQQFWNFVLLWNWVSFTVNVLRLNHVHPLFIKARNTFIEPTRCRHCTRDYGGGKIWKTLHIQPWLTFLVLSPASSPSKLRVWLLCSCNFKAMFCFPSVYKNMLLLMLCWVSCVWPSLGGNLSLINWVNKRDLKNRRHWSVQCGSYMGEMLHFNNYWLYYMWRYLRNEWLLSILILQETKEQRG